MAQRRFPFAGRHPLHFQFHRADSTFCEIGGKIILQVGGEARRFRGGVIERALHRDHVGIHERERVQHKVKKGMTYDILRDIFCPTQHQRVVIAKIPDVGNATNQRLDNDVEFARPVRI